jgi:D-alanyl-D-alanine carboxypeptidase/D-alanyl-D-alanine-endopeptidase (penicillin-binding protein 4)
MDVKRSIHFSKNNLMPYLLDSCRWVDGSGLSRYNLFKPNSIIKVLEQILNKTGIESVKKMFPLISVDETSDSEKSHGVFAKSGTLSNNYNLSGYIITKKSNVYLFSFMNNHFLTGNRQIKTEMHKILSLIIEKY